MRICIWESPEIGVFTIHIVGASEIRCMFLHTSHAQTLILNPTCGIQWFLKNSRVKAQGHTCNPCKVYGAYLYQTTFPAL